MSGPTYAAVVSIILAALMTHQGRHSSSAILLASAACGGLLLVSADTPATARRPPFKAAIAGTLLRRLQAHRPVDGTFPAQLSPDARSPYDSKTSSLAHNSVGIDALATPVWPTPVSNQQEAIAGSLMSTQATAASGVAKESSSQKPRTTDASAAMPIEKGYASEIPNRLQSNTPPLEACNALCLRCTDGTKAYVDRAGPRGEADFQYKQDSSVDSVDNLRNVCPEISVAFPWGAMYTPGLEMNFVKKDLDALHKRTCAAGSLLGCGDRKQGQIPAEVLKELSISAHVCGGPRGGVIHAREFKGNSFVSACFQDLVGCGDGKYYSDCAMCGKAIHSSKTDNYCSGECFLDSEGHCVLGQESNANKIIGELERDEKLLSRVLDLARQQRLEKVDNVPTAVTLPQQVSSPCVDGIATQGCNVTGNTSFENMSYAASDLIRYLVNSIWPTGLSSNETLGNITNGTVSSNGSITNIQYVLHLLSQPDLLVSYSIANGTSFNLSVSNGSSEPNWTQVPAGSDIWKKNSTWVALRNIHVAGVVSNLNGGLVKWNDVSFVSYRCLLVATLISYPALVIAVMMAFTVLISLCLIEKTPEECSEGEPTGPTKAYKNGGYRSFHKQMPSTQWELSLNRLTPHSKALYMRWTRICRMIPVSMIFGIPLLLVGFSYSFPQEVFSALMLVTSVLSYSNFVYGVVFGSRAIGNMKVAMARDYSKPTYNVSSVASSLAPSIASTVVPNVASSIASSKESVDSVGPNAAAASDASEFSDSSSVASDSKATMQDHHLRNSNQVTHWVILPQYKEDFDVLSMTLTSIRQSSISKSAISILLAMEQRESTAEAKAKELKDAFTEGFSEILVSYHPSGLPDDPPGKASNVSWAFKVLYQHLMDQGQPIDHVILTISDADSDFHQSYFEALTKKYWETHKDDRDYHIWQSPIFHLKNYHRQPFPVVPGSVITSIMELACLNDPYAKRLPYSTYSLPMTLAVQVGGWDAEWIAEDWHMGLKCFLHTLGRTTIQPILLPTINYTPEKDTWWGTVWARWEQAKRHALGFSDLVYYFSMLPLMHSQAVSSVSQSGTVGALRGFWIMFSTGLTLVIKIVNIHVVSGVLATYMLGSCVLETTMSSAFNVDRHISALFTSVRTFLSAFGIVYNLFTVVVSVLFVIIYDILKPRLEGAQFKSSMVHFLYIAGILYVTAPVYFLALGVAVWKAAVGILLSDSFVYEVAAKPTKKNRLMDGFSTI